MKYFAVAQRDRLYLSTFNRKDETAWFVCNEKNVHILLPTKNSLFSWKNGKNKEITCVRCHPLEELVATGDVAGRIFLWRNLFRKGAEPTTVSFRVFICICIEVSIIAIPHPQTLYHWHHTSVNAIAFTESGTNFYSGGDEAVLVRWNLNQSDNKSFLPRVWGNPRHISVSVGNQKIALATNDNGIQILNTQLKPISIIQNFTWISDDKTVQDKFPIGLKVNPRTSSLVLNGRVGHLQFFSTHTRSLLFNVSIQFCVYNFYNLQ